MPDAQMPTDWDDHGGWEAYYHAVLEVETEPFELPGAVRFLPGLLEAGWTRVWLPGCGISRAPSVFAAYGFDVLATDVSQAAVDWQAQASSKIMDPEKLKKLLEGDVEPAPGGGVRALVHDFRRPLEDEPYDTILNIKSFQALPEESMRLAAASHFAALKPGRQAFFDTQNVQGKRRDQLEGSLVDAGFVVPLLKSQRWYRKVLAGTGIPHLFILGNPMIRRVGAYADDEAKWKADMAVLRGFRDEHQKRREAEWEETKHLYEDGESRIANVIYNTG